MNKYFLAFTIALLALTACKNEDPATLEIVVRGNYDGQALLLDELTDYTYYDGTPIKITNVRFFMSDVSLMNGDAPVEILDVQDIDFSLTQRNAAEASTGQSFIVEDLDAGEYSGLQFGIGLNAAQNAEIPSSFNSTHPLGNTNNEYWDGWDSYIFAKVEGRQDQDGDGIYEGFSYHVGFNEMLRDKKISTPINLREGSATTVYLDVDVKKLFTDGTTVLDLAARPIVHSDPNVPENWAYSNLIMDQFVNAITVR